MHLSVNQQWSKSGQNVGKFGGIVIHWVHLISTWAHIKIVETILNGQT